MSDLLHNKIVVIVGGTSGLGLSAALAVQAAGASVVAVGRDDAHLASVRQQLGDRAIVMPGDACRPATADEAIATAIDRIGRFDALYHVAGGSARKAGDGPLHELTDDGIDAALALNLKSVMYSNRAAVRAMQKHHTAGAIVNLSSVLAYSPSRYHFATHAYAAAKAAIIGFTKSCAAYYAPANIRFNVIAPGLVETPMAQRAAADETIQRFIASKQPLDGGRIAQPADLDAAVVYLLSDAAKFVTGQVLAIDGGWSVTEGQVTP
jgi:NAD(P)-dependent dehydrogenase (short-subunit alcohol dehydrogenase family)